MDTTHTEKPAQRKHQGRDASDEDILAFGSQVLLAEVEAVREAHSLLGASFIEATRLLLGCKGRVCVTGMGKAGLIGNKIQATLASTGTLAYSLHPVEALHGDLGMIHSDDVVIALSKSGSSELVALLPRLGELGCQIILLTSNLTSAAAAHADCLIPIGQTKEACPLGLAPSSSTVSMLALGDALALTVMQIKSIQPEQYASYHPGGSLGRLLLETHQIMRSGADCPTVSENASLGECHRAILAAPRRAGAAGVVDDDGRLVGIVTHGDFFRLFDSSEPIVDNPVASVMTRSPKSVLASMRVTDALRLMREHAIDELPVVDGEGRLVGIIDIQDLIARGFSSVGQP